MMNIDGYYGSMLVAEEKWDDAFKLYRKSVEELHSFIGSECKKYSLDYDPMELMMNDEYRMSIINNLKDIYESVEQSEKERDKAEALYDEMREGDVTAEWNERGCKKFHEERNDR